MLRFAMAASAAVLTLSTLPAHAADAKLQAAVASADRGAENKARDGARNPAATLGFWGLKAKQTVIEISPEDGIFEIGGFGPESMARISAGMLTPKLLCAVVSEMGRLTEAFA